MKYLLIVFAFLTFAAEGQQAPSRKILFEPSSCYVDHFDNRDEKVFTKIEIPISFKGGENAFLTFLLSHIDFSNLIADLKPNERFYTDTASIKFIVSKKGILSDLTITRTTWEQLKQELFNAFRQSGCHWIPGNFSGRLINGWCELNIYYTIDRRRQEFATNIGYQVVDAK